MAIIPTANSRRKRYVSSEEIDNRDQYPATSRYKGSRYFNRKSYGVPSTVEPETWSPPEILPSPNDRFTTVKAGEVGRLDLISARVYGTDKLWWVIAYINDIIDPIEGTYVNRELRYPPFDTVASQILS